MNSLRCPLCHAPLQAGEKSASCAQGHSFDRAREGYFNLLPVQQKNSLNPGDDAAMVAARRAFLEAGFYARCRDTLAGLLEPLRPAHLVDSGCGEGWYTVTLGRTAARTTAFDISKDAVRRAARRDPGTTWLVASSNDIPMQDAGADALTAIFSPLNAHEAARVLRPGGHLLIAAPGERHLWELRAALYPEVRAHQADKWMKELSSDFVPYAEAQVHFAMTLEDNDAINQLLRMTPHYWRASRERRAAVEGATSLSTQVEFRFLVFRRSGPGRG